MSGWLANTPSSLASFAPARTLALAIVHLLTYIHAHALSLMGKPPPPTQKKAAPVLGAAEKSNSILMIRF